MRLVASLAIVIVALVSHPNANAHESRPLYVEIVEKAPKAFAVTWKIPPSALRWQVRQLTPSSGSRVRGKVLRA